MRRLPLNKDGKLTYCVAPEERIGRGRCNHILHSYNEETAEEFMERANIELLKIDFEEQISQCEDWETIKPDDKLIYLSTQNGGQLNQEDAGLQTKWYWDGHFYKEYLCLDEMKQNNSLSEVVYSKFLQLTNMPHVDYQFVLEKNSGKAVSKSKNFLPAGARLVPFTEILSDPVPFEDPLTGVTTMINFQEWLQLEDDLGKKMNLICKRVHERCGVEPELTQHYLADMIQVDLLIRNGDRHTGNLAIIELPDGHSQFAPVYDNGAALYADHGQSHVNLYNYLDEENDIMSSPSVLGMDRTEAYEDLLLSIYEEHPEWRVTVRSSIEDDLESMDFSELTSFYGETTVNRAREILLDTVDTYIDMGFVVKERQDETEKR